MATEVVRICDKCKKEIRVKNSYETCEIVRIGIYESRGGYSHNSFYDGDLCKSCQEELRQAIYDGIYPFGKREKSK